MLVVVLAALVCSASWEAAAAEQPTVEAVRAMLAEAKASVRIACFGDSITGVYYHTGGRRAWCDMLGIALGKVYPKARIEMINAGISGHTTSQGLGRIDKDVLARKPQLVVVMFGMNDVARTEHGQFETNLRTIVRRCRQAGAAVVLCTPNSVYPNQPRPMPRLAKYAQTVRQVADEMSVPLADCFAAYEGIRRTDPTRWKLLMSETIHPSMNGHRLMAEVIAETVSLRPVSLADVEPPADALRFTFKRLESGQPLDIIAMEPYDRLVPEALGKLFAGAKFKVTTWPVEGRSLEAIEQWSQRIRKKAPHLVVVAVPAGAEAADEETFIRSYSWVFNWSVHFGRAQWDLLAILPSVTGPLDAGQLRREQLARQIVGGMDTRFVQRRGGDSRQAAGVLLDWITRQKELRE